MASVIHLPDKLFVDSRMCLSAEGKAIEIKRGATNLNINTVNSQQASNSTIIFTQTLPKGRIVIDPLMYVQIPISVKVTAAAPVASGTVSSQILSHDMLAPRQFPVNSCLNNISLSINNQTISSQPYQWVNELARFMSNDYVDAALRQSAWPVMPDMSPQYEDLVSSGKSPLLSYTSATDIYSNPRGVFNEGFITDSDSTTEWVFHTTLYEPLLVPILDYDPSKSRVGFPHLNNLQIQMTFISNLARMFSLDNVSNVGNVDVANIEVNIQGPAILRQNWLTVPNNLEIPSVNIRSYDQITCIPSQLAPFTAGQQQTVTSQSLTFNQVPKKIYIYVRESQIDQPFPACCTNTDTTFSIQKAVVTFNNKTGLLSNMIPLDLYNTFEAEKGSVMSFTQSQYFVGNVLCIDPCESFGLEQDLSAGVEGNFQFQIELTCTNLKNSTVTPAIYVVYSNDTICTINEFADTTLQQSFVKREHVLQASSLPPYPSKFLVNDMYGGSFWDTIKNAASKAWQFIKDNKLISKAASLGSKIFPEFAPVLGTVGNVSSALGVGRGGRSRSRAELMRSQKLLSY